MLAVALVVMRVEPLNDQSIGLLRSRGHELLLPVTVLLAIHEQRTEIQVATSRPPTRRFIWRWQNVEPRVSLLPAVHVRNAPLFAVVLTS